MISLPPMLAIVTEVRSRRLWVWCNWGWSVYVWIMRPALPEACLSGENSRLAGGCPKGSRPFAWQERKNMRKVLMLLLLCCTPCFARSRAAKHTFQVETGFPRGRRGYMVTYRVQPACGGADAPYNMQWQTIADGKAQNKRERQQCKKNRAR